MFSPRAWTQPIFVRSTKSAFAGVWMNLVGIKFVVTHQSLFRITCWVTVDPALQLMLSVIKVPRLPMTSVSLSSVEASWSSRTDEPAVKGTDCWWWTGFAESEDLKSWGVWPPRPRPRGGLYWDSSRRIRAEGTGGQEIKISVETSKSLLDWKSAHGASSAVKSPSCVRQMTGSIKWETRYSAGWSKGLFTGEAGFDVCEPGTSADTEGETGVDVCEAGSCTEADSSSSMRCRRAAFSCWTTAVSRLEWSNSDHISGKNSFLRSRNNSSRTKSLNEIPSPATAVLGLPSV